MKSSICGFQSLVVVSGLRQKKESRQNVLSITPYIRYITLSIHSIHHCFSIHHYITISQARKSGWLSKRGGRIHTWHRRWFVLTGDMLFYYKNPQVSSTLPRLPSRSFTHGRQAVPLPMAAKPFLYPWSPSRSFTHGRQAVPLPMVAKPFLYPWPPSRSFTHGHQAVPLPMATKPFLYPWPSGTA